MSHERQIPRLDPENRMGLNFHAARALSRKGKDGNPEFEGVDSAARRAAIERAGFRNEGAHLGEAEKMRAAMLELLDRLEGRRTPEQARLLELLEDQADFAASVWTEKRPILNAPSKDQLIAGAKKWLSFLPGETLDGLLSICPETSRLVVVPDLPVPELMQLIGGGYIGWPEGWNHVKAPTWRCAVTDGREDMPFDPAIFYENSNAPEQERRKRTNEAMVAEYERIYVAKGLTLMPQHGYVPAAAEALARGQVIDRQFYTAFKRPPGAAFLPCGDWSGARVVLDGDGPENSGRFLRGRPWVEGEMSV